MSASPRLVSLVPSITETLVLWQVPPVACTRFCEQPGLGHVGGTKNPDVEAIVGLAPDAVLMDTEENRREDHDALVAAGVRVVVTEVHDVRDVAPAMGLIAAAAGVEPPNDVLADPEPVVARRRALVPIWRRPWMAVTADTYAGSVLHRLGVDVVPPGPGRYPEIDLGALAADGIDLVLVPSEPYSFTDAHLGEIRQALPAADVRRVDGQDLFWWGARTPGALTRLQLGLG